MQSIKPLSPYTMIWGWIKDSVFLTFMVIIMVCCLVSVMLTLVNIELASQRELQLQEKMIKQEEKHRTLVMSLMNELVQIRQRWDYEVSAAADARRARIWHRADKRFRRNYIKNLRRLKRKYPNLEGIFDKEWKY